MGEVEKRVRVAVILWVKKALVAKEEEVEGEQKVEWGVLEEEGEEGEAGDELQHEVGEHQEEVVEGWVDEPPPFWACGLFSFLSVQNVPLW